MKKILLILLFLPIFVFAELDLAKVNKALLGIKSNKTLSFYTTNNRIKLKGNLNFTSFKEADILLFSKKPDKKKLTIVDSYKSLKTHKNSIGAIYIRKGRTQIVFVQERLEMNGLKLASNFKKHLIHDWQLSAEALLKNIK
ncbi:MAG: Unknown protein [uncultured Sulfurovum sp.]|uniref:Uncharacterized protein n=1 Tax=uncultured Sulfurovum sp. TaxID=269237 RepID=A0A6S6T3W1_9BACT|nr:MAG: Unknown protein [uncultured Sulfurovum sp.]